ncbi:hypothetical protein [Nitrospira sp. NS4]|uniref:hypothetical protein n=1 Tax=Nitrospira sp. NS4 TaxID=3414498 RepID=UPI003C2B5E7D
MNRIRPELIKDNPAAPQPYVSPRRSRTRPRTASSARATAQDGMREALQMLMRSAERFVDSLPASKNRNKELPALLIAMTQAHRLLSPKRTTTE